MTSGPNSPNLNPLDYQVWAQCWSLNTSCNRSQNQFPSLEICLDNNQGNFQLHRFTTSTNIAKRFGLLFLLTHCINVYIFLPEYLHIHAFRECIYETAMVITNYLVFITKKIIKYT